MKINMREIRMLWITLVVVLLAATYWVSEPKIQEWQKFAEARDILMKRRMLAERVLRDREMVETRMRDFRANLPVFTLTQDITAQFGGKMEAAARDNNVNLSSRNWENEKPIGDLFEAALRCDWDSSLDDLVRFLYALQAQGAMLDIRRLTIKPGSQGPKRLDGKFIVDYAYRRSETTAAEPVKGELTVEPGPVNNPQNEVHHESGNE